MKWTLEEFDRQPFPFVLEMMEYFAQHPPEHILLAAQVGFKGKKRGRKMGGYENEEEFRKAGLLPSQKNTAASELSLPAWVREVRQDARAKKMAASIEGKKPDAR